MTSKQDYYNRIKSTQFAESGGKLNPDNDLFTKSTNLALSEILVDVDLNIQERIDQCFISTATTEYYLNQISANRFNGVIQRKGATQASGSIVVVSSIQTDIPAGTTFISGDQTYTSLNTRSCTPQLFSISASRDGAGLVTCTANSHPLVTNMEISINIPGIDVGNFKIIVLDKNTFTYQSTQNIVTSATGTGQFLGCVVELVSSQPTKDANKTNTDTIEIGVTNTDIILVGITYDGIYGGSNQETIESFAERLLEYSTKPQNSGNPFQHASWIKNNTTANFAYFFMEETSTQLLTKGIIGKYDELYNFTNFTTQELNQIKDRFASDNQIIFGSTYNNLYIQNPTYVGLNIQISNLSPNTLEMKNAISKILKEYLAKLPIKFYLTNALSEVSNDKLSKVASSARDSNGNNPTLSLVVVNVASLNSNITKPILGNITY